MIQWLAPEAGGWDDAAFALLAPFPAWVTALVILAAVAILGLSIWNLRGLPGPKRLRLGLLRAAVVALALYLYLQPAIRLQDVTRVRNHLVLLIDGSRSMSVADGAGRPSRLAGAQALVRRSEAALTAMAEEHVIDVLSFDDALSPLTLSGVSDMVADGDETRLVEALNGLSDRYQGKDIAAVVIMSDGADHGRLGRRLGSLDPAAAAATPTDPDLKASLAALGVPVHTITAGRPEAFKDLAIRHVASPEFAFVHDEMAVEVTLAGHGVGGRMAQVRLERDGRPVQNRSVRLPSSGGDARVRFTYAPNREERAVFTVVAEPLQGEALTENNRRDFVVRVIRDRVRVLQVAGHPSWDERFLRKVLKKNPNLELISFFILRTNANLMQVPNTELSLIPFPTKELFEEKLGSFDVVILQDFDYRPFNMARYLPRIKEFVDQGGAMLVVGGGQAFTAGGYVGTGVAEVLPVELVPEGFEETMLSTDTFLARMSAAGLRHPLTAVSPDPEENERLWNTFPRLEGINRILGLRPGAVSLLEHPTLTLPGGAPHPLLVLGEHGRGRVMAVLTDSFWRLGLPAAAAGGDPGRLQRLWNNGLRWLLRDPEWKRLHVQAEADEALVGEEVHVELLALDRAYQPAPGIPIEVRTEVTPGTVEVTTAGIDASSVLQTDRDGRVRATFKTSAPGVVRIVGRATIDGAAEQDQAIIVFRTTGKELDDAPIRDDVLRRISEATGGTHQRMSDAALTTDLPRNPPRVLRVDRRKTVELWNTPWALLLGVLLMSAEWWGRRKAGLL